MMKKQWVLLTGLLSLIGTIGAFDKISSLQEGVELRRIAEYCKEKNFNAVKLQIHHFFGKYPSSDSNDALHAMLGDILFSEKDYLSALTAYDQVKREELKLKTEFRRIHCLHQLARFEDVITSTRNFLNKQPAESHELPTLRLQLAHALFRQSLAIEDLENKKKYLTLSKEQFALLDKTDYADQAWIPLAHIHTFLKEYPQAVKMYLLLSEKDPKNKEEYLLQTLQLQLRFDRSAAIDTCGKIYELQGPSAAQAAFNQLSLLFQEKRYRDVAHFQDGALKYVASEHLALAHYYIGRSLSHIGDYSTAAVSLEKYLSLQNDDDRNRLKNALLTVLHCANETDNFGLFEKTLFQVKAAFPKDAETIKAVLLHTQLCKAKGKIPQAIVNLKEILESSVDLSQRDSILYDYALLHTKEQNWQDSALAFEAFVKQFPAHPQHKNAWRHLIACRFKAIKESSAETAFVKKDELAATLQRALKEHGLFSIEERKKMRFAYARALYEMQKYERALGELSEYLKEYHTDAHISEAYLLTALSHYYGTKDLDLFAAYAEKTLEVHPTMPDAPRLHLNLFNTYLSQVEKKSEEEKTEMLLKAADHLYQALDQPVKKENLLWLAHFYFHAYQERAPTAQPPLFLDRSIVVLEKILQFTPQTASLAASTNKLEMETEAIKLSELYAAKKRNPERICLLTALDEEYKQHPDVAWKYQRLAHFDLASAYKEEKHYEQALKTYSYLIDSSSFASSYFSTAAQLDKALLEYTLLHGDQKQKNAPEVQAICDALKDLEIKRKLLSEPCHLEAALAYIDILAQENNEQRVVLLNQMKESFSSQEDPLVVQYLSAKAEFPDKYALFEQYMNFIAAEIISNQALIAQEHGERDKAIELCLQAKDQLLTLSSEASHPRLKERIEKSKEELKRAL